MVFVLFSMHISRPEGFSPSSQHRVVCSCASIERRDICGAGNTAIWNIASLFTRAENLTKGGGISFHVSIKAQLYKSNAFLL